MTWLLLCGLAAACGDDDGGTASGDGGDPDADAPLDGIPAPAGPAPPVLTPCPKGWRETTSESGIATCDPAPEEGVPDCTGATAYFPGETGCVDIGNACGPDLFSGALPSDRAIVHVAPGSVGGDGTMALPFGRIADGLGAASAGDVVALGRGTFDEEVFVRPGVALWGACAAETTLTVTAASAEYVVRVGGAGSELRDLRLADSDVRGLWISRTDASLDVSGVLVEGVREIGVAVVGRLTGREVVVRDIEGRLADASRGWGIDVEIGGTVELDRSAIERARGQAALAAMTGSITLRDSMVRGTRSDGLRMGGRGVVAQTGGTATLDRVLLDSNRDLAVVVGTEGSSIAADHVVVRGTLPVELGGDNGDAMVAALGGALTGRRLLLEDNAASAITAIDPGSAVELEDVVVRRTGPNGRGEAGRGASVLDGGRLAMTRAVLEANHQAGIAATDEGSALVLVDLVVRGTQAQMSDGTGGRGLTVQDGVSAEVTRALFEDNRSLHFHAGTAGTRIALSDVVARRSAASRGLNLELGVVAEVTRMSVEDVHDHGIFAGGAGLEATFTDVTVREVGGVLGGLYGRGLGVQDGAQVSVDGLRIERCRGVAVAAFGGASLVLNDARVTDTLERDCAATTCPEAPAGNAIGAYDDGTAVSLTDFRTDGSPLCGLHLARGGVIDATDGEVSHHQIGACLQSDGFDPARVSQSVTYRDNDVNLEVTMLPVPDAGGGI
jgi:hypothetical protein